MTLSSASEVRGLYEASADSYNKMMDQEIQLPVYGEVLGELAGKLETIKGSILDSSCGTGHMLARLRDEYTPNRKLIGIDISSRMVELSKERLGSSAKILEGDMASLPDVPDGSCAAVISFFAIHHLDLDAFSSCLAEWNRVLVPGGRLLIAAWEGEGTIDYGDTSDVIATRYREAEVVDSANNSGFDVTDHSVKPVDDFDMDALYVWATRA